MEEGSWLLWLIGGIGIGAFAVVIASAKEGEDRRARSSAETAERSSSGPDGQRSASAKKRAGQEGEAAPPQEGKRFLIIPPPDQPRIEAVAPKNKPGGDPR